MNTELRNIKGVYKKIETWLDIIIKGKKFYEGIINDDDFVCIIIGFLTPNCELGNQLKPSSMIMHVLSFK